MYEDGISKENMNKTNKMIKCPGVALACHFVCRSRFRLLGELARRVTDEPGNWQVNPRLDWSSACTKMPTNWSSSSLFKRVCHYVFELSWKYKCSFIFWDVPLETAFCFDFLLFIYWLIQICREPVTELFDSWCLFRRFKFYTKPTSSMHAMDALQFT